MLRIRKCLVICIAVVGIVTSVNAVCLVAQANEPTGITFMQRSCPSEADIDTGMVALAGIGNGLPPFSSISVVWKRDMDGWFPVWQLGVLFTEGSVGQFWYPIPSTKGTGPWNGHEYETVLSVQPASGFLSLVVRDITAGEIVVSSLYQSDVEESFSAIVLTDILEDNDTVELSFVPIGMDWDYRVLTGSRAINSGEVDRQALVQLVSNLPDSMLLDGCFQLIAEDPEGRDFIVQESIRFAQGRSTLPFDLYRIPCGDYHIRLTYTSSQGSVWSLPKRELRVTDGNAELSVTEIGLEGDTVNGTVLIRSDTTVQNQKLEVMANIAVWYFRDDWSLLDQNRMVFTKQIDIVSSDALYVDFAFHRLQPELHDNAVVKLTIVPCLQNADMKVGCETTELYYAVRSSSERSFKEYYTDRKAAAYRNRRIIYNNDGNDNPSIPVTPFSFLERRTIGLEKTQVDTISYCTGIFNLYTQSSLETELLYSTGSTPPDQVPWALSLKEQGLDPLQLMIDYSRANDIEIWWSMRMNDTHDNQAKRESWQLSQWKRDHRHLLMSPVRTQFPYGWHVGPSWTYTAVNYEHEEVRNKVYDIIADVCTRYDLDGIELDFFRHPVFFRPQMFGEPVTDEQRAMMTALLKRVRDLTEDIAKKRGHPFLIVVRVPDSIGYAKEIGLDVVAWLEQGLIDIIIAAGIFRLEPWENTVELGRLYEVPVYACLSTCRLPSDTSVWREEALRAWEAGVNGVYTFNVFQPNSPMLRQLGDPTILRSLPHTSEYEANEDIIRSLSSIASFLKGGERYLDESVAEFYPEEVVKQIFAGQ